MTTECSGPAISLGLGRWPVTSPGEGNLVTVVAPSGRDESAHEPEREVSSPSLTLRIQARGVDADPSVVDSPSRFVQVEALHAPPGGHRVDQPRRVKPGEGTDPLERLSRVRDEVLVAADHVLTGPQAGAQQTPDQQILGQPGTISNAAT